MPIISRAQGIAIGLPLRKWFLHSILFEKSKWTKEEAKKWLKDNGHYYSRYRETANVMRWNQRAEILGASFRTKKLANGIDLVYEYYK